METMNENEVGKKTEKRFMQHVGIVGTQVWTYSNTDYEDGDFVQYSTHHESYNSDELSVSLSQCFQIDNYIHFI
jgi:hypothetical protein